MKREITIEIEAQCLNCRYCKEFDDNEYVCSRTDREVADNDYCEKWEIEKTKIQKAIVC